MTHATPMNGTIIDVNGLVKKPAPDNGGYMAIEPDKAYEIGARHYYAENFPQAEECFAAVINAVPTHAMAWSSLGMVYMMTGYHDDARDCLMRSLSINPSDHNTVSNLGYLYDTMGHLDHAQRCFERALELCPTDPRARVNMGTTLQRRLEFARAWPYMDARFETTPKMTVMRNYAFPLWDGQPTERLLVWPEAGVGDQIIYATMLTELVARGQEFVCELDDRLLPAFRRSFPGIHFYGKREQGYDLSGCTAHVPMMSLLKYYRNSVDDFAAQPKRLLRADVERAVALGSAIPGRGKVRVAISWRSFSRPYAQAKVREKSAALADFAELGERDDLQLVSVQYSNKFGSADDEIREWKGSHIHVPDIDLFDDIDGVLAVVSACDVVVTTSMVTAHFAGALGVPCYLIYRNQPPLPYWTPGPGGDQIYYPSVKNICAPEWSECIEIVDGEL